MTSEQSAGARPAVSIERRGPVGTVVLHRPEARNAVDPATAQALAAAFRTLERRRAGSPQWSCGAMAARSAPVRTCAPWRRAGTRADCRPPPARPTTRSGRWDPTRLRLGKPVIAAVAGHAVAGGLELALWCDLRVAEDDAVFGVFCRRWGVPLIDGGTVRLPRLIGAGPRARHDPHRPRRARGRSTVVRARQSSRAERRVACRGRSTRRRDRRVPAGLPARRSRLGARTMAPRRGRRIAPGIRAAA